MRDAARVDREKIRTLALDNDMFAPDEMGDFDQTLDGFLTGAADHDRWLVAQDENGDIVGAAYYAPEPLAARAWNLYFLAANPARHRSGIGTALINHVEQQLSAAGGAVARVLLIDTSSTDKYRHARAFYARQGYEEKSRHPEFYGPDDDKVTFWKRLPEAETS